MKKSEMPSYSGVKKPPIQRRWYKCPMHWWKFKMLLDGIAENRQIKERIYYRTVDVRQIKDRKEVSRIMRVRRRITIPEQELLSDEEIGNAFV